MNELLLQGVIIHIPSMCSYSGCYVGATEAQPLIATPPVLPERVYTGDANIPRTRPCMGPNLWAGMMGLAEDDAGPNR